MASMPCFEDDLLAIAVRFFFFLPGVEGFQPSWNCGTDVSGTNVIYSNIVKLFLRSIHSSIYIYGKREPTYKLLQLKEKLTHKKVEVIFVILVQNLGRK